MSQGHFTSFGDSQVISLLPEDRLAVEGDNAVLTSDGFYKSIHLETMDHKTLNFFCMACNTKKNL